MKRHFKSLACLCAAALFAACGGKQPHSHEHDHAHEVHEHDHSAHEHDHDHSTHNHEAHDHTHENHEHDHSAHDHNHGSGIAFTKQQAQAAGLVVETVAEVPFYGVIKTAGHLQAPVSSEVVVVATAAGVVHYTQSSLAEGQPMTEGRAFAAISAKRLQDGDPLVKARLAYETLSVAPENHYGRHKLQAEERALELCPDCVALRATWMYDTPQAGMHTHRNFIVNVKEAIHQGTPLHFATREFRGITWVGEVVRHVPHTLLLPGGVYNFGAENRLNTYETALAYLRILQCSDLSLVVADEERFAAHVRNISISTRKIVEASHGAIQFLDTVEGLRHFENCTNRLP